MIHVTTISLVIVPVTVHVAHPPVRILMLSAELREQVIVITPPLLRVTGSLLAVICKPPASLHL